MVAGFREPLTLSLSRPGYAQDPVARRALYDGVTLPVGAIFLIHGYNTPTDRADEGFERFESLLEEASYGRLDGRMVRVIWPGYIGDAVAPGLHFYESIDLAQRSSVRLVSFLKERLSEIGAGQHVVLVAHSLGCLLAVHAAKEAISQALGEGALTLVLMAAAIPAFGDYRALQRAQTRAVLYSSSDLILRTVFPAGQWMADGSWSEAVGLNGLPESGVWTDRFNMQGHGHGDYWGSQLAAALVCELLGLAQPRSLQESEFPTRPEIPERTIPAYRAQRLSRDG